MTKSDKGQDKEAAVDPVLDPARMPDFSEALKLNPLMTNPAAAMAAATAIGFGFATQMASAFFGVMQGAMEAAGRPKEAAPKETAPEEKPPVEADAAVPVETLVAAGAAVPEPAPVVEAPKPKPVRKAPVTKPAEKKTVAKAVPAEAPEKTEAKAKAAPKHAARPKAAKAVAGADDLKRISGIGPKLEGLLKGMGVTSIAQVAAWTDKDIARFDKELGFEGRIGRDDWVGQAKALLK